MKNSKILVAICLILCAMLTFASCGQPEHTTADCLDENKDHKCDVCSESMGKHADTNKDHACDYGCKDTFGTCEDADNDHICDYGCSKAFGECADADNDHSCDYGCGKGFGTCEDADKDHSCDYNCGKSFGKCEDADLDHACDYGCSKVFGEHADADSDHACDYGCSEGIGECADADFDHACDYGCSVVVGEHVDADFDHACDYGCPEAIGEHADADKDHACDYGCSEIIGECADADLNHACDYGCGKAFGEHVDNDKNHACDYGCSEVIGNCADADKDHACDYGCDKVFGECTDADKNHACDYGCDKVFGAHADSADDADHVCDYGCNAVLENCSDVLTDSDHACDVCGKAGITSHVYGEWTKNDEDTHKKTCDCGNVVIEAHAWNNGIETIAPSCTDAGVKTFTCGVCGETKTAAIDALGHNIVNHEAQAPTCTANGWDAYETCTRCNYNTKVEKPAISHSFEWVIDKQPTLDEVGIKHEECSVCHTKRNENTTIDKLTCGHFNMVKTDAVAATCLAGGNKEYYFCSECNKYFSNAEGTLETTASASQIPALGHDMVVDDAVAPNCTDSGLTEGSHCSRCDYKVAQEVIPALGHDTVVDAAVAPTCTESGLTEGSHCTKCDYTVAQNTVSALGHDLIVDAAVAPTCQQTGLTEGSRCSRCDYKIAQEVLPIVGHVDNNGDKHCDYDGCDAVYYVVTLAGGATVTASTDNSSTYPGAYLPGTVLTISADTYKTVEGKTYMFVGFDKNATDNRIVNDGSTTVSYTVTANDVSITAKYAEANTTFLATGSFKGSSDYSPEGFTATKITESTDPDLEGLSGWSFVIPNNAPSTNIKVNNITTVSLTAWGIDSDKLVRFVLKNSGDYAVTVELFAEYFGFMVSTGNVTVPANSVVVAFMDFGPFSGAGTTCDFGMHIRENMTGDGNGTIQLDVVASAAKKYETKVSDFIVTSDKNVFMDFGESNESNTQANVSQAKASNMNLRYWDQYGVMYFYGNNDKSNNTYARERANALGDQAISLKTEEKFIIYVKVTNLYHGGDGKYSLVFTRGSADLSSGFLATQVIEFSEYGESYVYAIEIDPTILKGGSDNLQFGLKKAKADGTGGKVDVLIQIASENIFGEEPVNQ